MPLNTFVENAWYVAGRSQEFPLNQPKGLKICSRPVLVWRTAGGKLVSFDDRCVHKRMPLSGGEVLSVGVRVCAEHGVVAGAVVGVLEVVGGEGVVIGERGASVQATVVSRD